MIILVFDTCFNKTYIALKKDGKILTSSILESDNKNYHSAYLIPQLRNILKNNNILIKDIDLIGVNIGPGSFTGIRAGLTIARVLAQQFNIKLCGINSLKILSKLNKTDKRTMTILDARKNKVYFSVFNGDETIIEPTLILKEDIIKNITTNDCVIADTSINEYLKEYSISSLNYEACQENLALNLLDIVEQELKKSDCNWAKVKPMYIQSPSITLSKKNTEAKNV